MNAQARRDAIESRNSEAASPIPSRHSRPNAGDVLASERFARADVFAIGLVAAT
jgi:hypothetical protein